MATEPRIELGYVGGQRVAVLTVGACRALLDEDQLAALIDDAAEILDLLTTDQAVLDDADRSEAAHESAVNDTLWD